MYLITFIAFRPLLSVALLSAPELLYGDVISGCELNDIASDVLN